MLRGACALAVFLNHWAVWSDFQPVGSAGTLVHGGLELVYQAFIQLAWPTGGQHPAVICFFVLSGFCVHGPFERRLGQPVDWRGYFHRRTRRIMPVYWAGALLGLVYVLAYLWRPAADPLLQLHATATPAGVAARLGGWAGLWPEEIFAGNYTLGTVAVEILIYLMYPLFFLAAAAGRWWLLALIAVGLQFLALALRHVVDPFVLFSGVLVMALFWYLGALAAHLRRKLDWRVPGWWLGAGWALFLLLQQTPHFFGLNMLKQLVWGLLCMGGIVWLISWEERHQAKRGHALVRLLRGAGDISYPLYAMHTPVILLVNWGLLTAFASRSYAWQLSLNLVLPVLVAILVHREIERRFYRPQHPG
ncbi:Acyltransferase family protein [Lacunisphaera limnophila]|uniref:Acyltransferase family protein n=2 Tax=Lacunisphaera limnophila TaxID=1838286 RepID=A0A1D8AUS3_9BACT|nr:Acyltransferase family protein [Lacunisphaera limnophila]